MSRPQQRLLAQLASSPNEIASGLGQCLEALRLISALPRTSPVFVHYTSAPSPTIKAFGREHLSRVPLRTVITLVKSSLSLSDPIRVTTALFYREDGTIDPTPALVDEDSWKELGPYVHTLHVEADDHDHDPATRSSSTALSSLSSIISATTATSGLGGGGCSTSASPVVVGAMGTAGPGSGMMIAKGGSGLNSNASTFVPNGISIKTSDGSKVHLQSLRKSAISPTSPQATSPFAILDNTGGCV